MARSGTRAGFDRDEYAAFRPWSSAVLALRDVVTSAGEQPVSLELSRGRALRLEGPDAPALATVAAGHAHPTAGEVAWGGSPIASLSPRQLADARRGAVGWLPAAPALLAHLTAYENVLSPTLPGRAARASADAAAELLEELGLGERGHERVSALDAPERRLVALARALVLAPAVLVTVGTVDELDEELRMLVPRVTRGLAVLAAVSEPRPA